MHHQKRTTAEARRRAAPLGRSGRHLGVWLALVLFFGVAGNAYGAGQLDCQTLPRLMGTFLQNHLEFRGLTLELRDRVAEMHLRHLDPSRSLLLDGEAEELHKALGRFFTSLGSGDCRPLLAMHELTLSRYRAMEEFVRNYVSDEAYQIDREATLVLDPEDRGFPISEAAQHDLYRRLVHFQMSNYLANGTTLLEAKEKLIHRYELVTRRASEFEKAEIYGRFLESFASALDPHSAYLAPDSFEDFQIHMGLSLEGIGAVLSSRDGYTVVEEIVAGGAADKNGDLRPKDKIISVGQGDEELVDVIDMDLRDVVRMIRGKKGSTVRLAVLRQGAELERMNVRLVRDKIDLEDQAAKVEFIEHQEGGATYKLALLQLPSFYGDRDPTKRQASDDMRRLLAEVKKAGADGLLLDLSQNSGGLLDYAVEITGLFLESGGIVAVGTSRERNQVLRDPDDGILYAGPLVVLTSRITASAGEILAGAIKDYHRGVIVGDDHTFGKGSVQTVAPLPDGLGALKLTTALFFRPGGASTQRSGVDSDIVLPSLLADQELGERYQHYALPESSVQAFLPDGTTRYGWKPLAPEMLTWLSKNSATRVSKDERFTELEQLLAQSRANDGVVKVADLLEGVDTTGESASQETAKPEAGSADAPAPDAKAGSGASAEEAVAAEAEPKRTPQLEEAIAILADLVARETVAVNALGD